MKKVVLEAKNLNLVYKTRMGLWNRYQHQAVDNVSLQLFEGEILGIRGRNGAGKTTLLRILAGVLQPDSGEVVVAPGLKRSLLSLKIGFNAELTGRENAIMGCLWNGFTKKEAYGLVEAIKDFSELGTFFDQPVRTYSSGMCARLGFSTAMMSEIDILMLDELLSVGDTQFKEKAEDAMMNKLQDSNSVIFVSHNEKQIDRICSRTIILDNGAMVV